MEQRHILIMCLRFRGFIYTMVCLLVLVNADIFNSSLTIRAQEHTIAELWKQVEKRTPLKIEFKLADPLAKKQNLDGLYRLSELVEITKEYYRKHYEQKISSRYEENVLKFVKMQSKSIQRPEPKKEIKSEIAKPKRRWFSFFKRKDSAERDEAAKERVVKPKKQSDSGLVKGQYQKNNAFINKGRSRQKRFADLDEIEPLGEQNISKFTILPRKPSKQKTGKEKLDNEFSSLPTSRLLRPTDLKPNNVLKKPSLKSSDGAEVVVKAKALPSLAAGDYRLKPGDQIEISVWGEEDMDRVIVIRPDGKISYLLVGEVAVVGLTFKELKKELEERLSKYINEPTVSIIGRSFEGNFVSILGAVKNPGRKVVSKNDRVLDVLAKANGLRFEEFGGRGGEVANLQKAYLSRKGKLLKVNFSDLIYNGDMSQNHLVEIGDFIYIPSSIGAPVFITGEVRGPTSMPFRGQPTLLEAITEAGGFNTKAKKNNVYIVKGGLSNPVVTKVDYNKVVMGDTQNVYLQPGDIVHVPPTTVTKIERLSAQILPFLNAIIDTGAAEDTLKGRSQLK